MAGLKWDGSVLVGDGSFGGGAALQISGTTNATTSIQLFRQGNIGTAIWAESGTLRFGVDGSTGFTERMRITSTGNIGIGTSSPGSRLHLNANSGNCDLTHEVQGTSSAARTLYYRNGGSPLFYMGLGAWSGTNAFEIAHATGLAFAVKSGGQFRTIPLASDPSGAEDGDVYYNSTTNKLRVRAAGSWVDLH